MKHLHPTRLVKGIIHGRPNRFLMNVEVDGILHSSHCPSTGRIFDIDFNHCRLPCLLSDLSAPITTADNKKARKTRYTVEAISLDSPQGEESSLRYIGINQNRVNTMIEQLIRANSLPFAPMGSPVGGKGTEAALRREVKSGSSRIDFRHNNRLIEVKMQLAMNLFKFDIPEHVTLLKKASAGVSSERLIKHFNQLSAEASSSRGDSSGSTGDNSGVVCLVFQYHAKPFTVPENPDKEITAAVERSIELGIRYHQVNIAIDEEGFQLLDTFPLDLFPPITTTRPISIL